MRKHKIIVFGDLPIATKVVEWVCCQEDLELVGCVSSNPNAHNNDPWKDVPMLRDYCREHNVALYELKDLPTKFESKSIDLGLVCRYSKIIKKDVIDLFNVGLINMHGGLLPEYAGPYSCNYAVFYNASKGGGTLHWIDEGIDTGDIIRRCEFDIEDCDTGYSVFQKTQKTLYENMIEIVKPILAGEMSEFLNQEELIKEGYEHNYFCLHSIDSIKKINTTDSNEVIMRKVRACDFPGYEPAYFEIDGKRIYMRMHI